MTRGKDNPAAAAGIASAMGFPPKKEQFDGTKNALKEQESLSIQKNKKKKLDTSREEDTLVIPPNPDESSSSPSYQNVDVFMSKSSEDGNIFSNLTFSSSPDDSNKEGDVIVNTSKRDALALLKQLVKNTKACTKKAHLKAKWDFKKCPHEQFDKTMDDTFMCFIMWAKVKKEDEDDEAKEDMDMEGGRNNQDRYNVSRAFRRLQSYAEWIENTGNDLIEPPLSISSVKETLEAFKMCVSKSRKSSNLVWWVDIPKIDKTKIKKELELKECLRAFVWYIHFIMYDNDAQENGVIVVENCGNKGFFELCTLMPMNLSDKLEKLTFGVLPVRLVRMYFLESPRWMQTFLKFMSMFMSEKLVKRIVFLNKWSDVGLCLGEDCIPKNFGELEGQLEVDAIEQEMRLFT